MNTNETDLSRKNTPDDLPDRDSKRGNVMRKLAEQATGFRMLLLAVLGFIGVACSKPSEPQQPVDPAPILEAIDATAGAINKMGETATDKTNELYDFLFSKYCKILFNFDDSEQCEECFDGQKADGSALNVSERLDCDTQWLYHPRHTESVLGDSPAPSEIESYKLAKIAMAEKLKIKIKFGIEEIVKFIGKVGGKIDMFKIDPQMFSNQLAVSRFFESAIEEACKIAGLSAEECLMYKILAFENSGSCWAKNENSGAVGVGQLMPMWVIKGKNNLNADGIRTENAFQITTGNKKAKRVTFDGRYDPITNVDLGARIIKYLFKVFGKNHPDFVMLAYNQGEGDVNKNKGVKGFVKTWAEKHITPTVYTDFYKQWRKQNPNGHFKHAYFLDYLHDNYGVNLAMMLMDTELVKQFMGSDNGGAGYVPKILAMHLISQDHARFGIPLLRSNDNAFPAVTDAETEIAFSWHDLFEPVQMPNNISLRNFAETKRYDINTLMFINRQVRDIDATFGVPVRIWIPKVSANDEFIAKMTSFGSEMAPPKLVIVKKKGNKSDESKNNKNTHGKNAVNPSRKPKSNPASLSPASTPTSAPAKSHRASGNRHK